MGDHKAFFYGTLMAPEVLYRVCYGTTKPTEFQKSLITVHPAILHGYERHRVKGCDYPAIVPLLPSSSGPGTKDVSVRGTYVTGLTDGDMWRLDIFEGDEYKRENVDVHRLKTVGNQDGSGNVEDSETVNVQTYVYIAGREHLEDGEWDFADFMNTKMKRWTGAEEYEEVDEAVKAATDKDPTGGRGQLGAISERLREEGHRDGEAQKPTLV